MATLERFEDCDAWKKVRELTKSIYQLPRLEQIDKEERRLV